MAPLSHGRAISSVLCGLLLVEPSKGGSRRCAGVIISIPIACTGGVLGAPWLKATLVQIAWPATRKKDSYFRALFHRLKARRGPKKAIVAVAASILTTVYHLLRDGTLYQDLGPSHFDAINRDRAAKSLVRRLNALGFDVDVRPVAA